MALPTVSFFDFETIGDLDDGGWGGLHSKDALLLIADNDDAVIQFGVSSLQMTRPTELVPEVKCLPDLQDVNLDRGIITFAGGLRSMKTVKPENIQALHGLDHLFVRSFRQGEKFFKSKPGQTSLVELLSIKHKSSLRAFIYPQIKHIIKGGNRSWISPHLKIFTRGSSFLGWFDTDVYSHMSAYILIGAWVYGKTMDPDFCVPDEVTASKDIRLSVVERAVEEEEFLSTMTALYHQGPPHQVNVFAMAREFTGMEERLGRKIQMAGTNVTYLIPL